MKVKCNTSHVTHHVDCCPYEDAVVKGPEECDEEADEARNQIDPFKVFSQSGQSSTNLTFTVPDRIWFILY